MTLQDVLELFERFKRRAGRKFAQSKNYNDKTVAWRDHNLCENAIAYLEEQHGCQRVTSKAYKLQLKEL